MLVFGRYEHVTAMALLGRPINPYWDVRYASDVTAMFVRAAPVWGVVLALLAVVALVALVYVLLRWALGRLARAMAASTERLAVGVIAAATMAFFVVQSLGDIEVVPQVPVYSTPVIQTYARQAQMIRDAIVARSRPLAPSPEMSSDLSLVAGADVLLVFMESYGAITWQRPDFVARLAPDRARLAEDIQAAGKGVVSTLVESPTFGGSSWFAHISFLSGIEVRDPNTNALLMTQQRETVVTEFARHGYRTLAVMPGLWSSWPEGRFLRISGHLRRRAAGLQRSAIWLVGPSRISFPWRRWMRSRAAAAPAPRSSSSCPPSAPTRPLRRRHPTSPIGHGCSPIIRLMTRT